MEVTKNRTVLNPIDLHDQQATSPILDNPKPPLEFDPDSDNAVYYVDYGETMTKHSKLGDTSLTLSTKELYKSTKTSKSQSTSEPSTTMNYNDDEYFYDYDQSQLLPGPEGFDDFPTTAAQPSSSNQDNSESSKTKNDTISTHDNVNDNSYLDGPPPVLILNPTNTYVVRNQPAELSCRALYARTIRFKCNGRWVDETEMSSSDGTDPVSGLPYREGRVMLSRPQVQRYHGLDGYTCACFASRGPDSAAIRSDPARVRISQLRKHFYTTPSNERLPLGSSVRMPCLPPDGEPKPETFWMKDGVYLRRGVDPNVILSHDGSLLISAARLSDSGNYTCGARNLANTRLAQPAELTIYVDGGWSSWASWSGDCSVDCATLANQYKNPAILDPIPKMSRFRQCNKPAPRNKGNSCKGDAEQWMDCDVPCAVHGAWTEWSTWSPCSQECHQFRTRQCAQPQPKNGGRHCQGVSLMTQQCGRGGYCRAIGTDQGLGGAAAWNRLALVGGLSIFGLMLICIIALIAWVCCRGKCSKRSNKEKFGRAPSRFDAVMHGDVTQHTLLPQHDSIKRQQQIHQQHQLLMGTPLHTAGTDSGLDCVYSMRSGRSSATYGSQRPTPRYHQSHALTGSKAALLEHAVQGSSGSSGHSSTTPSVEYGVKGTVIMNTPQRCLSRQSDENYATLYDFCADSNLPPPEEDERDSMISSMEFESLTVARIDHRGGRLSLPHCGVALTIPEGAIDRNNEQELWLAVCRDQAQRPHTQGEQTLLSPIVACGPSSLVLRKPVIVTVPHCALLAPINTWRVTVYTLDDAALAHDTNTQWQHSVTCGEETLAATSYCLLDNSSAHVMCEQLQRVALIGSPRPACGAAPVKRMRLMVYAPIYPSTLDYSIRVYCVEATAAAEQSVAEDEACTGGYSIAETRELVIQPSGDLCLCLDQVSSGWRVKPGADYQEIPAEHLWHASGRDHLHCSFSLELSDGNLGLKRTESGGSVDSADRQPLPTVNLAARLAIYQKGRQQARQIMEIDTAVMHGNTKYMSGAPSRSDSAVHTGGCLSSHQSAASGSPQQTTAPAPPCSISPSSQASCYTTGPASFKLPTILKRQLAHLLDRPVEMENDWRMLAKQLSADCYIQYFGFRKSPTEHILDLWEARESSHAAILQLMQVLRMMGRIDAVELLEQFLQHHPVAV